MLGDGAKLEEEEAQLGNGPRPLDCLVCLQGAGLEVSRLSFWNLLLVSRVLVCRLRVIREEQRQDEKILPTPPS